MGRRRYGEVRYTVTIVFSLSRASMLYQTGYYPTLRQRHLVDSFRGSRQYVSSQHAALLWFSAMIMTVKALNASDVPTAG